MRDRVLVELHSDGFVKAYARRGIGCRIINRPHITSAADATLVDELVANVLPGVYRDLYWPGLIRATGQVERITIHDIAWRLLQLQLLKAARPSEPRRLQNVNQAVLEMLQ